MTRFAGLLLCIATVTYGTDATTAPLPAKFCTRNKFVSVVHTIFLHDGSPDSIEAFRKCDNKNELLNTRFAFVNQTALMLAIEFSHDVLIYDLLTMGADPNVVDTHGRTAVHRLMIHIAVALSNCGGYQNSKQVLNPWIMTYHLLDYGGKINTKDRYGWTPGNYLVPYFPGHNSDCSDRLSILDYLLKERGAVLAVRGVDIMQLPATLTLLRERFHLHYDFEHDEYTVRRTPRQYIFHTLCTNPARVFVRCYALQTKQPWDDYIIRRRADECLSAYSSFAAIQNNTESIYIQACETAIRKCSVPCDTLDY